MRVLRIIKTLVLGAVLALSLGLNVATVAIGSVANLVSGAYEAVTGAASVVGRRNRDLATKRKQLDAKIKQVASLSEEVTNLRKPRVVSYRGQRKLVPQAIEDTAARVSKRTVAGASRNAGSLIAEGIPFAGIAVIVGVTAWDLRDACGTMKDLHELELAFDPKAAPDPEAKIVCGLTVPTKGEVWAFVKSSPGVAWGTAKAVVPDLPELKMPKIDWTFWN